ncbi:MAG: hypothetical protein HC838_12965 [Spirulinaceae cyanobacterium RM2_2_10]|nr:hypothetical protein [Spirulinaceae cyanobacterium SM2_1_0]NJO20762.1 hypothetical protein [Spirulinaceae cyanobacterium RM2_2_10]
MQFNRTIIQAVEQSGDRVTVADIAARAGLGLDLAQRELVALAAAVGGNLEVAESGDLVYRFPRNILGILRAKSRRLQWQQTAAKVWRVLFALIRMSFGIILIASLVLIVVAIVAIAIAAMSAGNREGQSDSRSRSGSSFNTARLLIYLNYWVGPNWYRWLQPGYGQYASLQTPRAQTFRTQPSATTGGPKMSFLDAVFSFLFGDGDPNADLEQRRWQAIATVIRQSGGAVTAEQIAPYLDAAEREDEDYMLPVLARFNGYPDVTEQGELIYAFPELQVTAGTMPTAAPPSGGYLHESRWEFSAASRNQLGWVTGLGFANITLAVLLGWLLWFEGAVELGGVVALAASVYGVLLVYAIAFLAIPGLRYLWLQQRNAKIDARNQQRRERAQVLAQPDETLQHKLAAARQLEVRQVITAEDLAYSTSEDLLDQNLARQDEIDREWQQKLAERQQSE